MISSLPPMPLRTPYTIESATVSDMPTVAALLQHAELPYEDIAPHVGYFLVAREGDTIVGAIGAEVAGSDALLRSLVVAADRRGHGIGDKLVEALERAAAVWGVERWWLLTTTAQRFFAARGFCETPRSSAPPAIRQTGQFSGGCCCSAVCLTRTRRAIA